MSVRDEIRSMSSGFRWGRRPLVPRSAEPYRPQKEDSGFPTDWARTTAGVALRQAILKGAMKPLLRNELSLHVHGLDNLDDLEGPVIFFSNHSSHLDATLIMTTLPDKWRAKTAVGAARDYFFDVWWRQAFTAIVYGGFPIERGGGVKGVSKARELLDDGWSLVLFPEGTRSPDGHVQRFRLGTARLCVEAGVAAVPIGIRGAYQSMPKGRSWPKSGRLPVTIRYGRPLPPSRHETHQELSRRMAQSIAQLHDEDRTSWWEALGRAERGETPTLSGPRGPRWLRGWEGSRPVPRRGPPKVWE